MDKEKNFFINFPCKEKLIKKKFDNYRETQGDNTRHPPIKVGNCVQIHMARISGTSDARYNSSTNLASTPSSVLVLTTTSHTDCSDLGHLSHLSGTFLE